MKKIFLSFLISAMVCGLPLFSFAQGFPADTPTPPAPITGDAVGGDVFTNTGVTDECGGGSGLQNPLKFCSLEQLLVGLLQLVIQIGSLIIIIMVIYTGFLFVMARGNPSKIEEARTALLWTLIGGVILLGAQGITLAIQETVTSITG